MQVHEQASRAMPAGNLDTRAQALARSVIWRMAPVQIVVLVVKLELWSGVDGGGDYVNSLSLHRPVIAFGKGVDLIRTWPVCEVRFAKKNAARSC